MTEGMKTIIYPVRDLAKAKALFTTLLGAEPRVDSPYYVGYGVGDQHVGLNPHGHGEGMAGPTCFLHVDDIESRLQALLAAGAEPMQGIKDVGGGRLIASVKDADGNVLGLLQDRPGQS